MPLAEHEGLIAAGRRHLSRWELDAALAAFDAAILLAPDYAPAHYLRGEAFFLQRRLDAALECHAAALRLGIDHAPGGRGSAMSGMVPGDYAWMTHMLRGDFESAWQLADRDRERRQRHQRGNICAGLPRHSRAVWDGRSLAGEPVLVRCFHGLGDTIQFIRYAPLLAAQAAAVRVEIQPALLPLLASIPGIDRSYALPPTEDRSACAFGCSVEVESIELPHAFRTTVPTIPAAVPYLRPEPALAAAAGERLRRRPGLRVGVVWAAGAWKPERSLAPPQLKPLGEVPGVRLICLQRGPAYVEWRGSGAGPPMENGFASDDIAATAATIVNLDLVITVDTMVAHLAGALGVPVWLMLHFAADWRWLLDRDDSPWYPTMRLFRQARPGEWGPVVAAIADGLRRRLADRVI